MAASPEICRQNGSKSRGPKTTKGKAIASRNATKHGILSQKPPLLATEDLDSFQGMIQSLIDEYQPETPTEQLLIQQIAMGWTRLHRLWRTEAATANLTILIEQKSRDFPYFYESSMDFLDSLPSSTGKSYQEVLVEEKGAIASLINGLTHHINLFPDNPRNRKKWTKEVLSTILNLMYNWPNQTKDNLNQSALWLKSRELINYFDNQCANSKQTNTSDEATTKLASLLTEAKHHLISIHKKEIEIQNHEAALEKAELNSKGLAKTELFSRYEQHITKQLTEALDRLTTYQEKRKHIDPMGSFGKPE